MSTNPGSGPQQSKSWTEEIEVAAGDVVNYVQNLINEGNVRRLIVKYEGNTVLEVPVTIAAAAGIATLVVSPLLAALGALAGLVARVQIVIEREGEKPAEPMDVTPPTTPSLSTDHDLNTVPPTRDNETQRLV